MKNIILILIVTLFFIGCKKENEIFSITQQQLVGKEYSISYSTIRFISEDSLVWEIERLANESEITSYRLQYELKGDSIHLAGKDTVRVDYTIEELGVSGFVKTYYSDSFNGAFVNNRTLSGKIINSYDRRENNASTGFGGSTADVSFILK